MTIARSEAAKKWCPFARVAQFNGGDPPPGAGNREPYGNPTGALNGAACCIADECMAWRWLLVPTNSGGTTDSPVYGYCGLAGSVAAPAP